MVKVAGRATGMDAIRTTSEKGRASRIDTPYKMAKAIRAMTRAASIAARYFTIESISDSRCEPAFALLTSSAVFP